MSENANSLRRGWNQCRQFNGKHGEDERLPILLGSRAPLSHQRSRSKSRWQK